MQIVSLQTTKALLIIAILLFAVSCGKDDAKPVKIRDIKFEVTGNFSGTMDATFITANGGATNESISSLPWTKSITYQSSVSGTTITIGGGGGVAGQTLKVKVSAGGSVVSETPGVANSSGVVVVASPTYIF
jgi:hypothetical protein